MENSKYHEIAEAAVQLFNKKGYHATSMQDIADYVGLQKGSLYHYISSKEELLERITSESISGFVRELERIVKKEVSAKEKLEHAILMHFTRVTDNIPMTTILLRESFSLSDDPHELIKKATDHYLNLWSQIIEEGMTSGEFKAGDPRIAALTILGACNWAYRWYQEGGKQKSTEVAKYIIKLMLTGMIQQ